LRKFKGYSNVASAEADKLRAEISEIRRRTLDLAECFGGVSQRSKSWLLQRWLERSERSQCSFCGKRSHEVAKLIAGPAVMICSECVDVCRHICESGADSAETSKEGHAGTEANGLVCPDV
jgi:hypothetical protein